MTVSFFLNDAESKKHGKSKALFFGFSIIAIFCLIGTLFSLAFGGDAANLLATHWIPNLIFFIIFIVFAASFFGLFGVQSAFWSPAVGGVVTLDSGSVFVTENVWYHFAITYNTTFIVVGNYSFYVNGSLYSTGLGGPNAAVNTTISIGNPIDPANFGKLNGSVNQLMTYTARLSATEIAQIYNAQKSRYGL